MTVEDDMLALAEKWEPKVRASWRRTVRRWTASGELESLLLDVSNGASRGALQAKVSSLTLPAADLAELLADVQLAARRSTIAKYGYSLQDQSEAYMRRHGAARVAELTQAARRSLRTALAHGFENGFTVQQLSASIRTALTLDERSQKAVDGFTAAMEKNEGMKKGLRAKRIEEYRLRMVAHRADTIARTEAMLALNVGKRNTWLAAHREGLLDATDKVEWITAKTERTCTSCAPMHGKKITLGAEFDTSLGSTYAPPLHPNCRCTIALVLK